MSGASSKLYPPVVLPFRGFSSSVKDFGFELSPCVFWSSYDSVGCALFDVFLDRPSTPDLLSTGCSFGLSYWTTSLIALGCRGVASLPSGYDMSNACWIELAGSLASLGSCNGLAFDEAIYAGASL